jgi:signal transduction histidine kinase
VCVIQARRLLDLQLLPFIVVTNPHIKKVYEAYWHAFNTLRLAPVPTDGASNDRFSALLRRLVDEHSPMLDALAAGLREVRRKPLVGAHLRMDAFLEAMLRSRISRRVLAEQHINLTHHRPGYIGVINLDLSLADSVDFAAGRCRQVCLEHFGAAPEFIISGDVSLRAPYIPAHLDYMLYEIMKNAARAVVERHMSRGFSNDSRGSGGSSAPSPSPSPSSYGWSDGAGRSLPPVHVRICGGEDDIAIRISDQGGGIPVAHIDKVWEFGWTDLDPGVLIETSDTDAQREGLGLDTTPGGGAGGLGVFQAHVGGSSAGGFGKYRMAGLGFGLPLSRLYARYFGGDLKLVSLPGYGVDAFLQLKGLVAERREWKEEDGHKEVEAIAGTASQDNGLRSTLDSMNQNI